MPAYPGQYDMMRRASALMPTLSRLGLSQLPAASHLPAANAAKVARSPRLQHYRNQRDEWSVIPEVFAQAQALTTLGDHSGTPVGTADPPGTASGAAGGPQRERSTGQIGPRKPRQRFADLWEDVTHGVGGTQAVG